MIRSVPIRLYGARIATLTNLAGDYNLLSFEESYLDDPATPILSQSFMRAGGRTRVVPRTHRVAPPYLANLLPEEGSALRALVSRQYSINVNRDYPYLWTLGRDLPGAVTIGTAPSDPEFDRSDYDGKTFASEGSEDRVGFSLAGFQLKFSAAMVRDRFSVTLADRDGLWIAKLPTNAYARLPENEFLVMSLAKTIGLPVPEIELVPLDSILGIPTDIATLREEEPRLVYVIKRFDRRADGTRVHVEDFNQVVGQKPNEKYDNYTSSTLANIVATFCSTDDVDDLVRRLVFGIMVGNDDMHLKNWSLAYPDRRAAVLAPMYDYVCTRAYMRDGNLALTVGGERRFDDIGSDAIVRFAKSAEISSRRALLVARETIADVRDAWPAFRSRAEEMMLRDIMERHFETVPLAREATMW